MKRNIKRPNPPGTPQRSNFQKIFNPTEQEKEEKVIIYLQLLISLVKDKDCCTCKHHETRTAHMHSYETQETWCCKYNRLCCSTEYDTCDEYEVCSIKELLGDKYD